MAGAPLQMMTKPKLDMPIQKGWATALTSKGAQLVIDSYKNQTPGIILMREIDWALALALELDPQVVRYRYVWDQYRPMRQVDSRWRFIVQARNRPTYLIQTFERDRRKSDKKRKSRRCESVYFDDLQRPEIILSNSDANSYLVAAWDHITINIENRIFEILQDQVVRTLRETFEMVGGSHPVFVAALLRLYMARSIDMNLQLAPLGWLTHVAALGRLIK